MEINDFLQEFGLSQYEKMAYLTLLRIGNSKSKKIAKESGVSYGRIYEVLEKLEKKGLITIFPTEPKTFESIDPKLAFNLIIQERENNLNSLKGMIAKLEVPQKIPNVIEDKTLVLQGKQKQISMISEMHQRAKKEILMIPGVYEPIIARKAETIRVLRKGVKIKRLIRKISPVNNEFLKESVKLGEQIRKIYLPGLRLTVVDNRESMISIVNLETKDRISIYTTNKDFAKAMATFFNSLWESSKKIKIK